MQAWQHLHVYGNRHPLQNLGLPACPERSYRNPVEEEYILVLGQLIPLN